MLDEILFFGISSFALTILIALWATRPQVEIVPEEERLVIYRFGKFNRLAGPGPVFVRRRLEQVERKLQVREEPHYLKFSGLYAYDIPVGYTLSLWYKLDPVAAANGDKHMLRKLVQFDSAECNENIRIRIHDLFIKHIADTMRNHQLSDTPTVLDKLIPFCPGQKECEDIIRKIRKELPEILRSFGAVWNPSQPITIKDFHLGASIIQLLDRDRVMGGLLQRMPNGDPDLLTQAAIALEGVPTQSLSKIVVEQNSSAEKSIPLDSILAEQLAAQATIPQPSRVERAPIERAPIEQVAGHRNIPAQRARHSALLMPS